MGKLNKELNKELSDLQIAILSNLLDKGTSTEQKICDKFKENETSKEIDTSIKKELNYLDHHNYITGLLNTELNNNNKIYQITSLGEEYIKNYKKSNNNQDELKNE